MPKENEAKTSAKKVAKANPKPKVPPQSSRPKKSSAMSVRPVRIPKVAADGVELDPFQDISLQNNRKTDAVSMILDKARAISRSELTAGAAVTGHAPPVMRTFWKEPFPADDGLEDRRGKLIRLLHFEATLRNMLDVPIQVKGTSAQALDEEEGVIHYRNQEIDQELAPLAKKKITIKPVTGNGLYTQKMVDGSSVVHVLDLFVVHPDAIPTNARKLKNEVIKTTGGTELLQESYIWDPEAEVLAIDIVAHYVAQGGSVDGTNQSFLIKFVKDLNVLWGVSETAQISRGSLVRAGTLADQPYDLTLEGWRGLGLVPINDDAADITVFYLAKFPEQGYTQTRRLKIKDRIRKVNSHANIVPRLLGDYPALRIKKLEDPRFAIIFPTCVGATYDASGMDLSSGTCTLRFSEAYQAFVAWDYSRGGPLDVEYGWGDDDPNYYHPACAPLPPIGSLQIVDSGLNTRTIPLPGNVHPDALIDPKLEWELVIAALITLIKAGIALADALKGRNARLRVPQT